MTETTAIPVGLELLDVVGDPSACLRFVSARNGFRPDLDPKSPADVASEATRVPGEALHVLDLERTLAARLLTIRDEEEIGSTFLSIFTHGDPGEPALGELVQLAIARAHAWQVSDVRCSDIGDPGHLRPLIDRHGFHKHTRWRRFELDVVSAPEEALLPQLVPFGLLTATLADRPDLLHAAFRMTHEGLIDAPGDFPRPSSTPEEWVAELDTSPVADRQDVVMLLDSRDRVLAVAQLELLAEGSRHACLEMLTVSRQHRGRGMAKLAKQLAGQHARERGLLTVGSMVHPDNTTMCAINLASGWTEIEPRLTVRHLAD